LELKYFIETPLEEPIDAGCTVADAGGGGGTLLLEGWVFCPK
jgi:hypothetical protein